MLERYEVVTCEEYGYCDPLHMDRSGDLVCYVDYEKMRDLARDLLAYAKAMNEGCDHNAGICNCGLRELIEDGDKVFEELSE